MPSSLTARSRHRREHPHTPGLRHTGVAVVVTSSVAIGLAMAAAPAIAAPEQGGVTPSSPQQGGVTPSAPTPEQGGVTPAPQAPQQPSTPEVTYTPGPGTVPAPPQEAPYQSVPTPDYDTTYTPAPPRAYTLPKPTPPVRPIAPPPRKIRVGNFVTDIPKGMPQRDVNSINDWSAYGESKIAQGLISVGVPEDEASRQAAATIIGVMTGGTAGAVTLGVPAAVTGAVGGALIGGVAGGIIGSTLPLPVPGAQTLPGVAIGAGAGAAIGAAALGIPAATVGAVAGGTLGGLIAHTLGAGDPGAHPKQPALPGQPAPKAPPAQPKPAPLPNLGANQFEVHVPADQAAKVGLPAVDYTVTQRGDVTASATVGDKPVSVGWSAEQAQAGYDALGAAGTQARQTANALTRQGAEHLQKVLPGAEFSWPQEHRPARR